MLSDPKWRLTSSLKPQGIIVGSDEKQEWILPWWWKHYIAFNTLPVCFVDFGLSEAARKWCEERGTVVSLCQHTSFLNPKEKLEPTLIAQWESAYGEGFWRNRSSWFKKPFALLQTPFETTLWLDNDCEVRADLTPLLQETFLEIGLVPEPSYAQEQMLASSLRLFEEAIYNSGVILYRHGSELIVEWARASLLRADQFWSDQHLLSRLLYEKQIHPTELSPLYNWHMHLGIEIQAKIIHWLGDVGKEQICLRKYLKI